MSNAAEQARSSASMEATRLHRRLGTPFDSPVDVLSIARELGLILMLQPLDNLLGFYVRGDDRSGIVINNQIPESLQRFTLAHEIGHHVLGHEGTADDAHALGRFDPSNILEQAAQSFASSLLMPLPLINSVLRDLPAARQSRPLASADAYLFSRQLGVSYEAGIWALYGRRQLTLDAARAFLKQGALAAKDAVRGQQRISDARADVWMLTEDNNDLSVMCRVGDEIHVHLPENTSTGLAWLVRAPAGGGLFDRNAGSQLTWSDEDVVELEEPAETGTQSWAGARDDAIEIVHDQHLGARDSLTPHVPPHASPDHSVSQGGGPVLGESGVRSLTFVPREEGDSRVVLELARPWDADAPALERYELDLRVRPKRLEGQGLFAPTAEAWVDEHVLSA
ncbi:MAG: ImmA/IrrE family metallo-endopeptidase [Mycobacterium sp.]